MFRFFLFPNSLLTLSPSPFFVSIYLLFVSFYQTSFHFHSKMVSPFKSNPFIPFSVPPLYVLSILSSINSLQVSSDSLLKSKSSHFYLVLNLLPSLFLLILPFVSILSHSNIAQFILRPIKSNVLHVSVSSPISLFQIKTFYWIGLM